MATRASSSAPTVVLEVSSRVTKVMIASGTPPQLQRINAAILPEQTDDMVAAVRALLSVQPLTAKRVGLLFGRETFSLRTLELPSSDPKEIASMLELQLGKLAPYPRADILSGWAMLGSFREGYTSVLLAIGRKATIEGVLQVLKTKGLEPQWVGVSSEGLESWWSLVAKQVPPVTAGQLVALIDVDVSSTDCAMLADGRLVFSHHMAIGAEQLSAEPARLRWLGELVRLPRVLQHEAIRGQVGRGVVTGLAQPLTGLVEQLASQWGVPIDVMDALGPGRPSSAVQQQGAASHASFTALTGVVISGRAPRIDLIPQEARVTQALHTRSRHLMRLAINLVIVLFLVVGWIIERQVVLRGYLGTLQQRLATLETTAQQVSERIRLMQQAQRWLDPAQGALHAMQAVAGASDPAVTVTNLAFADGEPLKIRGIADTVRNPYEFVDRLKQQSQSSMTKAGCYVSNAKSTGSRGAEFEVVCGKPGP